MKKKFIECDVCKKEITKGEIRYKFKEHGSFHTYYGDVYYNDKLDMCVNCYNKFIEFVNKESGEERSVLRRQIEDAAVKEFVDYLKSTQVSKLNHMDMDYIEIEDIELAEKEFKERL